MWLDPFCAIGCGNKFEFVMWCNLEKQEKLCLHNFVYKRNTSPWLILIFTLWKTDKIIINLNSYQLVGNIYNWA